MTAIDITIGWTKSEVVDGQLVYSSFGDGYRPGAQQHTERITIDVTYDGPAEELVQKVAESVFYATNSPNTSPGTWSRLIVEAIQRTGYRGEGAHYSLSVGDTVTVGEVMLACESLGWKRVTHA